jgi:hypothetical protein
VLVVPIAADDWAGTTSGRPVTISVLANDQAGTAGPPVITTDPTNGAAVVEPDGTITYTPDPTFVGTDGFEYEICSPDGTACDTATVSITVLPNSPPIVDDLDLTTIAGGAIDGTVTASDPDDQPVTLNVTSGPDNGVLDFAPDGTFTYTPNPGFAGTDTFVVEGCDPIPACDTGTVTITVTQLLMDDAATTMPGVPVNIPVLANDLGVVAPPTVTVPPSGGQATVNSDGSITYTPNAGFSGRDTFTYQACSSQDDPPVCDTALVTVAIGPIARPDIARTEVDGAVVITVGDNDAGTIERPLPIGGPFNGTIVANPEGTFTYTPRAGFTGIDLFGYEICDVEFTDLCDRAAVGIGVFPVAEDDFDTTKTSVPVDIDVEVNDRGDDLALGIIRAPANGVAVVGSVVYTPNAGFTGTDTFEYEACSPNVALICDQALVTVQVDPNDDPGDGGGSGGPLPTTGLFFGLIVAGLGLLATGTGLRCLARVPWR